MNVRRRVSEPPMKQARLSLGRRELLAAGAAALFSPLAAPAETTPTTEFQIACMTYVYRDFPLQRALEGIAKSGYRYVAWGTEHREADGKRVPVMAPDAPAADARHLGQRCRDLGLQPVMMFSTVYPENKNGLEVLKQRIEQAHAAGIAQVLTFGHTEGGNRPLWLERFRELGPLARAAGVLLVIKQHGGETGTGEACARITRELNDNGVRVCYDGGNVMDYMKIDPLPDLARCVDQVRSFCIKDHRRVPVDQDCGPGFGEIDHYRLLQPFLNTGRPMPLCCENIFAPALGVPKTPEGVDHLALRAREYLETVISGLRASASVQK